MDEHLSKIKELNIERTRYFEQILGEMTSVFIVQMILALAILYTVEVPDFTEPPTIILTFTRMTVGMLLQIKMSTELKQGLDKMKFASNHPWKFENVTSAFFSGFLQATAVFFVAILNYYIIMAATEVIEVVMNFLALLVISEIDDFFFDSHVADELGKKMVLNADKEYDSLYRIETTTSRRAKRSSK